MINFNKKDALASAVQSILQHEEVNTDKRTIDTLGGRKVTTQKDDVGPSSNYNSTKVKFHAGPGDGPIESAHDGDEESETKNLSNSGAYVKTEKPLPRNVDDLRAKEDRKKLGMKEEAESLDEKKWIAGAIKHPGKLHKDLGVPQGEKIPAKKLNAAAKAGGSLGKEARLAKTLKSFKEQYDEHSMLDQMIQEVLSKDAKAGDWIHDFVHSDNPKFAGKSKAKRKEMALAAYYSKQRNEEVVDEALKGNQKKIDKNHNGKIDAQDFKILRKEDTVEEGIVDALKSGAKKVLAKVGGGSDKDHLDRLRKDMYKKEEVEQIDEGKMDKMSLSQLWHKHAQHSYGADQGWGGGQGGHHSHHAATAIENHVRKHHGNKVADDMVNHSDLHVAHAEYVGGSDAKQVVHDAEKLRKKHGIKGDLYGMHNESVKEEVEQIDELKKSTLGSYIKRASKDTAVHGFAIGDSIANKKWSTGAKAGDMANKRIKGIATATDKLTKEETVEEGWDDMVKDAKEKVKSGPKPSGGSGVKQGTRYGGGKQKEEPKEKVEESKRPDTDNVPFVTNESKPLSVAKDLAKKSMKRMKTEMLGKISN